jgi:hypothetical protein
MHLHSGRLADRIPSITPPLNRQVGATAKCNCVAWPQTALLRGQRNLGPASGNLM